MQQVQNKLITIIGHKGHGKTKLTEILALMNNRPTIICDPRAQYDFNPRRVHFKSIGEFRKWLNIRQNFRAFYDNKLELVVPAFDDNFEELAEIVYKLKRITFVIDEVDMFAPIHLNNKTYMYKIIHYGRHNQIDIISTSRRPANISRNLTSQSDFLYFSKLREPNDKKYFKQAVGTEYLERVCNLAKFSFLKVDDEGAVEEIKTTQKMATVV